MALANAPSKAVADQRQVVKTRKRNCRRVLTWFASRWRNHQSKRAEKPHSIIQRPQGTGRPCYEAENSACRGEWRREAGSPASVGAPNVGTGKRVWRAPIPNLSLFDRKVGQGLIF